jgi:hypothetical protein
MEREVPGKTAERIWQAPIQIDWPPWMNWRADRFRPGHFPGRFHGVDDPHDDAADQQRYAHHVETLEIFPDHFRQQKRRDRSDYECNHDQAERMCQVVAVFFLAFGKGRYELGYVLAEINWQH